MNIYSYDKSFEGLLSLVFDAYQRSIFPDEIKGRDVSLPLLYTNYYEVFTNENKACRVWKGWKCCYSDSSRGDMAYAGRFLFDDLGAAFALLLALSLLYEGLLLPSKGFFSGADGGASSEVSRV